MASGSSSSAAAIANGVAAATALVQRSLHSHPWTSVASNKALRVEHFDMQWADMGLYAFPELAYFIKEAKWIEELNGILDKSSTFISLVYAYRGCVKAVPGFGPGTTGAGAGPTDDQSKAEFYRLVEDVVQPEINKMKQLMGFYNTVDAQIAQLLKQVSESLASQAPTEELLLTLARTLDMLMVMDSLKNMKSSLNNDFTLIFRRARSISKNQAGDDKENQMLYMFLANRDVFLGKVKAIVAATPGVDDLLWELANTMSDRLERGHYTTPKEKFTLIKAIAFSMALIDPFLLPKNMTQKKWRTDRFLKLFRANSVVPLYGDLTLEVSGVLSRTVNCKWDLGQYVFTFPLVDLRKDYADYFARLGTILDSSRKLSKADLIDTQCREAFDILVEGVTFLNRLASLILEMNANKYAHPTSHEVNPDCPEGALNYEQAIRYNYTQDERFALAEALGMLKNCAEKLCKAEMELCDLVDKHAFCFMNSFHQATLVSMSQYAAKKKKQSHSLLKSISELAGGSIGGAQVYMAKGLVEWILRINAQSKTGFMKERDLKDTYVHELQQFYHQLFWLPVVLNLGNVSQAAADTSELWYKEFYLELSKQIQFPIETSLPWILVNTILDSSAIDLTQMAFVPFLIYDDAANRALRELKMQYLYDEIEAEANLALDLFIYKYANKVFRCYKCAASAALLSEAFKTSFKRTAVLDPPAHQHDHILSKYKTISILGRTVPFATILTQMMNMAIRNSLEAIISRFESSDFTAVIELEQLLKVLRLTHEKLSVHLELDPFDELLAEVDEVNVAHGRILGHIASELNNDFCRQFSFNSITGRFLRCPIQIGENTAARAAGRQHKHEFLYGNKNLHQAYSAQYAPYMLFVGKRHFETIARLLGPRVSLLYSEIVSSFEDVLKDKITPYLWALSTEFPSTLKLPGLEYGVIGSFEYFQVILKPLLAFKDLTTVYQGFRELGNLFLSIRFLESAMSALDALNSYQRVKPHDVLGETERVFGIKPGPVSETMEKLMYAPMGMALVKHFVESMYLVVESIVPLWTQGIDPTHMSSYETSRSFYRIMSFLQFSFCSGSNYTRGFTCREVFGDSLHWAGVLLLCLTRQVEVFLALDFTFHVAHTAQSDANFSAVMSGTAAGGNPKGSPTSPKQAANAKAQHIVDFLQVGEYYRNLCVSITSYYAAVVGHNDYWKRADARISPPTDIRDLRRALFSSPAPT